MANIPDPGAPAPHPDPAAAQPAGAAAVGAGTAPSAPAAAGSAAAVGGAPASAADDGGAPDPALEREVAALIVEALNLEVEPDHIDPQAPLFGDGLGLDSIDVLEVALVVSKKYGFQMRSDDDDNVRIFRSLRSLAAHIAAHRVR